jgi:predicted esterase
MRPNPAELALATAVAATLVVLAPRALGNGQGGMRTLEIGAVHPARYYVPEDAKQPKPVVAFLHGMCALPEQECHVVERTTRAAWLLCPPGPTVCEGGGGAMWIGTNKKLGERIEKGVSELAKVGGDKVDPSRRALIGYSLGAPASLRIVMAQPGKWQRLMIVNASTQPSVAQLKLAKVKRIALVAGDGDPTRGKLQAAANRLAHNGVDAKFFKLEKTGHWFDDKTPERFGEPLAWLLADL